MPDCRAGAEGGAAQARLEAARRYVAAVRQRGRRVYLHPGRIVLWFGVGFPAAATVDGQHIAIIDVCNRLQVIQTVALTGMLTHQGTTSDGGASWTQSWPGPPA